MCVCVNKASDTSVQEGFHLHSKLGSCLAGIVVGARPEALVCLDPNVRLLI